MNINTLGHYFLLGALPLTLISCCKRATPPGSEEKAVKEEMSMENKAQAGPPVIIYKTSVDYYDKVPVMLSDDKQQIVSFPDIKDVFYKGELAYPTRLVEGYLLDNRGIGKNVAFLNITYEQYSRLTTTPDVGMLAKLVLDTDPLEEMYRAGTRYQYRDIISQLNDTIASGKLNTLEKIK